MQFQKVDLKSLLSEIKELESSWLDDVGRKVVANLPAAVAFLKGLDRTPSADDLTGAFQKDPIFLDVCRLFLGVSQESAAHTIGAALGANKKWADLRKLAKAQPAALAAALVSIGLPDEISTQLHKRWEMEDVLLERYKMSRGRAISGQSRGRGLENEVEELLKQLEVKFDMRASFTGKKGQTAKCDFAIPSKDHPKIVIESKGFEATGSKLTDFLGDVLKIGQAKENHTYFFVVTDGRGWLNRESDLKKIIEFHQEGLIEMVYTRARLDQLSRDVAQIMEKEA